LNNHRMKIEINPETQREEIRIESIKPDLALLHASFSDRDGNSWINGAAWGDLLLAQVSEKVVVSVEEKIENKFDALENLNKISSDKIDLLFEIQNGARPFESPGYYPADSDGLRNLGYQSEC
jgi:acyl CoA:acetate/3-ketoacid CoA transferase alpha subunit